MDFVALALNYLISYFLGISVDSLISRYYDADKNNEDDLSKHPKDLSYYLDIFDFIIVGGGTAGCVVANRLSTHNFKVLLLEAGGNPFPLTLVPSMAPYMLNNPNVDWGYQSAPQANAFKAHLDSSYTINQGKGLGGSSSLTYNMYTRGSSFDYDEWANIGGDVSWKYENLIPFFKKIEGHQNYFSHGWKQYQGYTGAFSVETSTIFPLREQWLAAGVEMGIKVQDPNALQGESVFPISTTTRKGTRFTTHRAYLNPALTRSNLRVMRYAQVEKIILNDKNKAVGVSYRHQGKLHEAIASREVILSAGAISTPKLLMLSGIGPKDHLQSLGIPVKVDLPVGKNLQDHFVAIVGPILVNKGYSTMDGRDYNADALNHYLYHADGPFSTTGFEAGGMLTSSLSSNRGWPDMFISYHAIGMSPNLATFFQNRYYFKGDTLSNYFAADNGSDSFFASVALARPNSAGEVTLASADSNVQPIIDPKFLSNENDIKVLVEGIKRIITMTTKTKAFASIGARFTNSVFPGCEEFTYLSDEYWGCYARRFCLTFWNPVGTCRMGKATNDTSAVVDSQLRVLGTTGLRVIDASIMPTITSLNTIAPTIMIAEKGSHMIIDSWQRYFK